MTNPLSTAFEDAFRHGGALVTECEFCGRTHFTENTHAGDWEEGELESLQEAAKKEPDKYEAYFGEGYVSYGYVNGRQFVLDCPCLEEKVKPFEVFLWTHRRGIMQYLQQRTERALKEAEEDWHAARPELPTQEPTYLDRIRKEAHDRLRGERSTRTVQGKAPRIIQMESP